MNKDVLNIASEDDITDVVQKIENAKNKIVAIVPDQNTEILHSIVNIKLINKTAKAAGKTAVIVTTDDSIINLAATLQMPVTKDLKSAPTIQSPVKANNNLVDEDEHEDEAPSTAVFDQFNKDKAPAKIDLSENAKKRKTSTNPVINWVLEHKKIVIASTITLIVFILFTIWATVFAPAASININVKTTSKAFSSNISFTTSASDEDTSAGKFYLEEKKLEVPEEIKFQATGSKNIGNKASGSLEVTVSFGYLISSNSSTVSGSRNLPANTTFTYNNLKYTTTEAAIFSVSTDEDCTNYDSSRTVDEAKKTLCLVTKTIPVTAAEVGEKYNVPDSKSDWASTYEIYSAKNSSAISGGSDKLITVVSEDDVKKAKESLKNTTDTEARKTILEEISEGSLAISSSFKKTVSDIKVTPAIDEEVTDNVTPSISVTTTMTISYVDAVRIEEFIRATAQLASDQKVYSVGEPFIENFNSDSNSGKLKTTYTYGPKITAEEILEKVKGKKIGEAKALLNSINGITSSIDTSFFWVSSIPNDPNKITININTIDSGN